MSLLPKIYGFNKASEIGIDVFAPSIFLGGCNFRCPYCMNAKLVKGEIESEIDLNIVKQYVQEEKSEWLMISGGEPTCAPLQNLIALLDEIRSWGCKIGMSTNGSHYSVLYGVISKLNYVALDIKSPNREGYEKLGCNNNDYADILTSRQLLLSAKDIRNNFDYEIRTTLYPALINNDSLMEIGLKFINKEDKWILQQFRHSKNMLDLSCKNIDPYSDDVINTMIETAKKYCNNVALRYV